MDSLKEKYPLLFRNEDPMEPINMFGIECNKGWFDLLDTTFNTLYARYKSTLLQFQFWKKLEPDDNYTASKIEQYVLEYEEKLKKEKEALPIVEQCKQKFGTLRLYCSNTNDYSDGIISMAERMSEYICDICGNSGKLSGTNSASTTCSVCSKLQKNK